MRSGPPELNKAPVLKILVGRFLTRSGDQAWDFAVPVTLVATSLTSLATLLLYGVGALLPHPENFILLVLVSVGAVRVGAAVFAHWSSRGSVRALL